MLAADLELEYNVDRTVIDRNVTINSCRDLPWLGMSPAHDGHAVIVGGGPSLTTQIEALRQRAALGHTMFAVNGSARWLANAGIAPNYHVLLDARPSNRRFVDLEHVNTHYLVASQCDVGLFDDLERRDVTLWHAHTDGVEDLFKQTKPYTLIASGSTVLLASMCIAYAMGYRSIHLYGADSSISDAHHAYAQTENDDDPVIEAHCGGRSFRTTAWLAAQVDQFQRVASELADGDAEITVHGDGLLPWVARMMSGGVTSSERDKYAALWSGDDYRAWSPGLDAVDCCLRVMRPQGSMIDFGMGSGKAALALERAGLAVTGIDFVSHCRDHEAAHIPFVEHDLTMPLMIEGDNGFCTDVMEHIAPENVDRVLHNIMTSVPRCFFTISTVPDAFGASIGTTLHLTVEPADAWAERFTRLGYRVAWQASTDKDAQFLIERT